VAVQPDPHVDVVRAGARAPATDTNEGVTAEDGETGRARQSSETRPTGGRDESVARELNELEAVRPAPRRRLGPIVWTNRPGDGNDVLVLDERA
jgi:hypothetical protein